MKVFGIGFSGYIGEAVTEKLRLAGHDLSGLARSQKAADTLRARGVRPIMGENGDVDTIMAAAREADAVIQMATGGFLTEMLRENRTERYNATGHAIESALAGTGKTWIILSGTGAWIGTLKEHPGLVINEDTPIIASPFYGGCEAIANACLNGPKKGIRGMIVVPAQVYGRGGGYIGPIARRFECVRKHGVLHTLQPCKGYMSFVHVDDLADLMVLALEKGQGGEMYIAASDTVFAGDLVVAVSRAAGLKGRVAAVSREELQQLDGWAAIADLEDSLVATAEKARRELGWMPCQPGVLEELDRIAREKIDIDTIYPCTERKETAAQIKL